MQPEPIDPLSGTTPSLPITQSGDVKLERSQLKDIHKSEVSHIHPDEPPQPLNLPDIKVSVLVDGDPVNILQHDIEELEEDVEGIGKDEQAAEVLARLPSHAIREFTKDDRAVDRMVDQIHSKKNFQEVMMIPLESIMQEFVDGLKERGAEGIEFGDPIMHIPDNIQFYTDQIVNDILRSQLAVRIPTQILLGGILINRSNIIDAAERVLDRLKKMQLPDDPKERSEALQKRQKLDEVIREQKDILTNEKRDLAVETVSYIPTAVQLVLKTETALSNVSPLMTGIGIGVALSWVATSAYSLWKAVKGAQLHDEFTAKHQVKSTAPARELGSDKPVTPSIPIEEIIKKRKSAHLAAKNKLKDGFFSFLNSLNPNNFSSLNTRVSTDSLVFAWKFNKYMEQFQPYPKFENAAEREEWFNHHLEPFKKLEHLGEETIDERKLTDEEKNTLTLKVKKGEKEISVFNPEILQNVINSEAFRLALLDIYAERQQTLTVETKQAVKSMALKKLESERKFFNFRVGSAATLFSMSAIAAAGTIALKVLACAGIIAATSIAISVPGLGLFIGGTILIGIGLFFLYKYKPNLFKGLLKGTAIALAFNKIPVAYYNYQLHKAKSLRDEKAAYVSFLSARISEIDAIKHAQNVPPLGNYPKLEELLTVLKNKAAKEELSLKDPKAELEQIHAHLMEELERYEKKKKVVDERIVELEKSLDGYRQRTEKLKLDLSERGTQDFLKAANYTSREAGQGRRVIDVSGVIAENIASGNIDDETKAIFKNRMGINLDDHLHDKNEVKNAMKHYFGLDREDMEKLIRKLKIREEIAVAAAAA